jgi:hypothetical protein
MKTQLNKRRDTDYGRRACNVLCWIIGALAAWVVVTALNGGVQ